MSLKSTDNLVNAEITTSGFLKKEVREGEDGDLEIVTAHSVTVNVIGGPLVVIEKDHIRIIRDGDVSLSVETPEEYDD